MTLTLTPEQATLVRPLMVVGKVVLGRIRFKPFEGDVEQCGTIELECGQVPENSLPALRQAIREADEMPAPQKKRRKQPR